MLYPTLMFKVGNVDGARAQEAWKTIPALMDAAAASGEFTFPRRGPSCVRRSTTTNGGST